ncbi:MAG TPA: hypothetical protein VJX31_07600 [Casimicrobiaceae bacterium]|nr:hypothetical protein [Casimicrobiaceae bacterium]
MRSSGRCGRSRRRDIESSRHGVRQQASLRRKLVAGARVKPVERRVAPRLRPARKAAVPLGFAAMILH